MANLSDSDMARALALAAGQPTDDASLAQPAAPVGPVAPPASLAQPAAPTIQPNSLGFRDLFGGVPTDTPPGIQSLATRGATNIPFARYLDKLPVPPPVFDPRTASPFAAPTAQTPPPAQPTPPPAQPTPPPAQPAAPTAQTPTPEAQVNARLDAQLQSTLHRLALDAAPTPEKAPGSDSKTGEYQDMAAQAEDQYHIPPGLLAGLIEHESNWDPSASNINKNKTNDLGIAQFNNGGTGQQYGLITDDGDYRTDPKLSISAAARKLSDDYKTTGSWDGALARYNKGAGYGDAVKTAAHKYGYNETVNSEGQAAADQTAAAAPTQADLNNYSVSQTNGNPITGTINGLKGAPLPLNTATVNARPINEQVVPPSNRFPIPTSLPSNPSPDQIKNAADLQTAQTAQLKRTGANVIASGENAVTVLDAQNIHKYYGTPYWTDTNGAAHIGSPPMVTDPKTGVQTLGPSVNVTGRPPVTTETGLVEGAQKHSMEMADKLSSVADEMRQRAIIDPQRVWNNAGNGGQVAIAAGLFLSGVSAGATGGVNQSVNVLNSAIERDMQAQQNSFSNLRSTASVYGEAFDKYRQLGLDFQTASQAARVATHDVMKQSIQATLANMGADQATVDQLGQYIDNSRKALKDRQDLIDTLNKGGKLLFQNQLDQEAHPGMVPPLSQGNKEAVMGQPLPAAQASQPAAKPAAQNMPEYNGPGAGIKPDVDPEHAAKIRQLLTLSDRKPDNDSAKLLSVTRGKYMPTPEMADALDKKTAAETKFTHDMALLYAAVSNNKTPGWANAMSMGGALAAGAGAAFLTGGFGLPAIAAAAGGALLGHHSIENPDLGKLAAAVEDDLVDMKSAKGGSSTAGGRSLFGVEMTAANPSFPSQLSGNTLTSKFWADRKPEDVLKTYEYVISRENAEDAALNVPPFRPMSLLPKAK